MTAAPRRRYPTAAEFEVLRALKEHHYLTVEQIMRETERDSLRAMQDRLTTLLRAGLVAKHERRSSNVMGPLRAGWSLTSRSKTYLQGAGMEVLPPRRPRPYTLDHCLTINDVLILAKELARTCPRTQLRDVRHDRNLRAMQPPLSVVPDGFLLFVVDTAQGRDEFPLLLEVDMNTTDRQPWQKKIEHYISFLGSELQLRLGTDVATVTIITPESWDRAEELKRWTESELVRQGASDLRELFYFTWLPPEISADDLFRSPRFLVAGQSGRATLLP